MREGGENGSVSEVLGKKTKSKKTRRKQTMKPLHAQKPEQAKRNNWASCDQNITTRIYEDDTFLFGTFVIFRVWSQFRHLLNNTYLSRVSTHDN